MSKQKLKQNTSPTIRRGLNLSILFLHDESTYPRSIMVEESIYRYVDETRIETTKGIAINKNGLSIPPTNTTHNTKFARNHGIEIIL